MDLARFRGLVDSSAAPQIGNGKHASENELFSKIRECFTPGESDCAKADVSEIIVGLGLRDLCDQVPCELHVKVAQSLQWALRQRGTSIAATSDWSKAVLICVTHASSSQTPLPITQRWSADVRVSTISKSVLRMRALGFRVELPSEGGVSMPASDSKRLCRNIERLSSSLGRDLATSAAGAMHDSWSTVTERFNLGRSGQVVRLDAAPQLPLAYLYQLGLRYFALPPAAPNQKATLDEIVELVTAATGLLDLESDSTTVLFARPTNIVDILRKSVMFDSVFLLTQAKVSHARQFLVWMMRSERLAPLSDSSGRTSDQILAAAQALFDLAELTAPSDFRQVESQRIAFALNVDLAAAEKLLREVFLHADGANQALSFPPRDTEVNASFRPLLEASGILVMQPRSMAARAILNASIDWCRKAWPDKKFDDNALGPAFEEFVRHVLIDKGISVLFGGYAGGGSSGECDAVIETQNEVMFLELKSKLLTREGRSGNDLVALADLGQALVRPQAQAMERHAALVKTKAMTIRTSENEKTVALGKREVLKISITRGDLSSLHDRPFLQHFLRAGCVASIDAVDPAKRAQLKELKRWFAKLRDASVRAGEEDFSSLMAFSRCWSLSVFQLLLLLERSSDGNSFSFELQRSRRIATPTRDFYVEYEFSLARQAAAAP